VDYNGAMNPTVYIETTVISYYANRPSRDLLVAAHQQVTYDWWTEVLPKCTAHISPVVITELERGAIEDSVDEVDEMALLKITDEVARLAAHYFKRLNLPSTARADSYHIALAAWHGMDYLVTWNCKHIAGARIRRTLSQLNAERGIHAPVICTPEELMEV